MPPQNFIPIPDRLLRQVSGGNKQSGPVQPHEPDDPVSGLLTPATATPQAQSADDGNSSDDNSQNPLLYGINKYLLIIILILTIFVGYSYFLLWQKRSAKVRNTTPLQAAPTATPAAAITNIPVNALPTIYPPQLTETRFVGKVAEINKLPDGAVSLTLSSTTPQSPEQTGIFEFSAALLKSAGLTKKIAGLAVGDEIEIIEHIDLATSSDHSIVGLDIVTPRTALSQSYNHATYAMIKKMVTAREPNLYKTSFTGIITNVTQRLATDSLTITLRRDMGDQVKRSASFRYEPSVLDRFTIKDPKKGDEQLTPDDLLTGDRITITETSDFAKEYPDSIESVEITIL